MTKNTERGQDLRHGLKLLGRTFGLVCLASLLWHAPVDISVLSWLLTAVAVFTAFFAGLAILVSAALWRNVLWRETVGRKVAWTGGPVASVLLSVPPLLALCALAAAIFLFTGWLLT